MQRLHQNHQYLFNSVACTCRKIFPISTFEHEGTEAGISPLADTLRMHVVVRYDSDKTRVRGLLVGGYLEWVESCQLMPQASHPRLIWRIFPALADAVIGGWKSLNTHRRQSSDPGRLAAMERQAEFCVTPETLPLLRHALFPRSESCG